MKKVIASLAALAAVSCAAVTASAASSIDFELNAAKSNATTKVIDVVFNSDIVSSVNNAFIDITFGDAVDPSTITVASDFADSYIEEFDGQTWTLVADNGAGVWSNLTNGSLKIAELTMPAGAMDAEISYNSLLCNNAIPMEDGDADKGSIAVVDAEEAGTFTDGEGVAVKAFTAAASAEGTYTWNVTDGANVATAVATDVTGGADVVIGLTVAGANVGNVSYAAVTID